jgi:hypothetical protein
VSTSAKRTSDTCRSASWPRVGAGGVTRSWTRRAVKRNPHYQPLLQSQRWRPCSRHLTSSSGGTSSGRSIHSVCSFRFAVDRYDYVSQDIRPNSGANRVHRTSLSRNPLMLGTDLTRWLSSSSVQLFSSPNLSPNFGENGRE